MIYIPMALLDFQVSKEADLYLGHFGEVFVVVEES